jgi:hypothetical protein
MVVVVEVEFFQVQSTAGNRDAPRESLESFIPKFQHLLVEVALEFLISSSNIGFAGIPSLYLIPH